MSIVIVLVSPRNPLNIGAAARAMSNFGFFELRLVNPYEVAFRDARSAVNASGVLLAAAEHPTLAHAVADCTLVVGTASQGNRELKQTLRRLENGARLIRKHAAANRVALVFGSEKFGLSNDDLSHCHWLMRIPTRNEHESMNLGQSVAVCLYELMRSPESARHVTEPLETAAAADLERLTEIFTELLHLTGYTNPKTAGSTHRKLRRLLHRLDLRGDDALTLLGMLRQMKWKLGSEREPDSKL